MTKHTTKHTTTTAKHVKCSCQKCQEKEFNKELEKLGKEMKRGQQDEAFTQGFVGFYARKQKAEADALKQAEKYEKLAKKEEERRIKQEKKQAEMDKRRELREDIKQQKIINKNTARQYKTDLKDRDDRIRNLERKVNALAEQKMTEQDKSGSNESSDNSNESSESKNDNNDKNEGGDKNNSPKNKKNLMDILIKFVKSGDADRVFSANAENIRKALNK